MRQSAEDQDGGRLQKHDGMVSGHSSEKAKASEDHSEAFAFGRILVGARGFEPPTPWSRTKCATRLRYAPMKRPSRSSRYASCPLKR